MVARSQITRSQHGLFKNRICQTNFIAYFDNVTKLMGKGNVVNIVYLGFSKAFDKIGHCS